jgi:hypothetical protein
MTREKFEQDEIKVLARLLCQADGNDPDTTCTPAVAMRGNGLLSGYSLAIPAYMWVPSWVPYAKAAETALKYAKSQALAAEREPK